MSAWLRLSALPLLCTLSAPASAQLLSEKAISAAMSMTIAQTALDTS